MRIKTWMLGMTLSALAINGLGCNPAQRSAGGDAPPAEGKEDRAATGSRGYTELNSSVIAVGDGDWLTDRCVGMVERAATIKQSKIMFVPTLFWVQTGEGPVDYYCYDRYWDDQGKVKCTPADPERIAKFQAAMQRCFQKAVDHNLSIALTPHLDDGRGQGRWRNILVFDPLEKRGGYSYAETVLYPLADALSKVARPDTLIYFGMQGEMSATVFRHPKSWKSLVSTIKDRIAAGRNPAFRKNIQVGVSTNFNKLCGCVGLDIIDPAEYVRRYPELWAKVKDQFDLKEIAALFDAVDYFGMSSYPSLYPNFPTSEVENAISQFDFEFSFFGLTVNGLAQKGKYVHFSEYGLGGGVSQNGDVKASDAAGAAKFPFFGLFGAYSRENDPWVLYDLAKPSAVRDYLRYFYGKTLEYLKNDRPYKYRVDAAFLWNQSSWDIQGIYPESNSAEGSYRDPLLAEEIAKHNAMAMSGVQPVRPCTDTPPDARYTCAQQVSWGKCGESFMQGYCDRSCGRCGD